MSNAFVRIITNTVLIMAAVIAILSPALALAAPVNIRIEKAGGSVGETITLSITAENTGGIAGGQFDLFYDPSLLTIEDVKKGDLMGGLFLPNLQYRDDGIRVVWANSQGTGLATGGICTMKLFLKEPGTVSLKMENVVLKNADGGSFSYVIHQGSIEIFSEKEVSAPEGREEGSKSEPPDEQEKKPEGDGPPRNGPVEEDQKSGVPEEQNSGAPEEENQEDAGAAEPAGNAGSGKMALNPLGAAVLILAAGGFLFLIRRSRRV